MAEYAAFHNASLNENVAYSTLGNLNGMGAVTAPTMSTVPGNTWGAGTGTAGSGDVAQNLLPVSMKIAAQTIGLDLVAVKPTAGPRIEMLFVDFKYDNLSDTITDKDERPQVFKIAFASDVIKANVTAALRSEMLAYNVTETIGGLSGRLFVCLSGASLTYVYTPTRTNMATEPTVAQGRQAWMEFLGFSRIDGNPMFRAFRQVNTAANSGGWNMIAARNTFPASTLSIADYFNNDVLITVKDATTTPTGATDVTASTSMTGCTVELVSLMEDHIPGFSALWVNSMTAGATREVDENTYPGVIGPEIFTKAVQVGDIEISSALKRTQIEDIKAATGMDIVQKIESVLINELTQTISKQIVAKIKELGSQNRLSATVPVVSASPYVTKFDYDVDSYVGAIGGWGAAPGGETTHSLQRKLIAKINNASNFIATDGRVGPAQYLITNGNLASVIQDIAGYQINPINASKLNTNGQLYPMGSIGQIQIYVDPYMKWDDNRIFLGRKNTVEQPGLVFIPYLMAQSISLISEATFAPRMLIRSRYAITEIGF